MILCILISQYEKWPLGTFKFYFKPINTSLRKCHLISVDIKNQSEDQSTSLNALRASRSKCETDFFCLSIPCPCQAWRMSEINLEIFKCIILSSKYSLTMLFYAIVFFAALVFIFLMLFCLLSMYVHYLMKLVFVCLQSTPLHLAAGYNRTRIVQLLIQHGSDVHAKDKG